MRGIRFFQARERLYEIPEVGNPGYLVRVHPTGRKVWMYRYRMDLRPRRLSLSLYRDDDHVRAKTPHHRRLHD